MDIKTRTCNASDVMAFTYLLILHVVMSTTCVVWVSFWGGGVEVVKVYPGSNAIKVKPFK